MTDVAERVRVLGTAFMEFASPEPQALVGVLQGMGFRPVARHRTNQAVLMRQATVDFIVTQQPGSHGMGFAAQHGPSCAGMAFRVADSAQAMALARQRGAKPLDAPSLLPGCALQGIGGSALYLVDDAALKALYAQFDFSEDTTPEVAAPFVRVDHVTHCVHPGNMDQWVSFYKNIFGFQEVFKFVAGDATNGFDTIAVRDPDSTACVTVVEPMGICHWLTSPHSPRIATMVRNGILQMRMSDSMFRQLPTPLDCISSTQRCPPAQAPATSATPSSSVVSGMPRMVSEASTRWISLECPASGT